MRKTTARILQFGILAFIIGTVVLITLPKSNSGLDAFAKCLSERELIMYGADWCSHCQNEKQRFGSSFQYVHYVECPKHESECGELGISGFPTWITKNGTKFVGEQGLEKLSEVSDCPLPQRSHVTILSLHNAP